MPQATNGLEEQPQALSHQKLESIEKTDQKIGLKNPVNSFLQNPSISSTLRRHGENIAEKSITVCSGLDMVNINLTHFVFSNKEAADVSVLFQIHTAYNKFYLTELWNLG